MKKLIMALALMPVMALADTEKVGEVIWTFRVSSEQVSVKGAVPCAGKLEIPATLGNCPVTSIGADAFFDCSDLTEVVIPEGVTSIGDEAFCDCGGLVAITIPSSITGIGEAAFEGCDILTTVYVSAGDTEGVKTMIADSDSGIDVDSLTFVELLADGGPYAEMIDGIEWTFYVESGKAMVGSGESWPHAVSEETVGALVVPSVLGGCPVTGIGDHAFSVCFGLTSVTIPSSVTSIGEDAFVFCEGLKSVVIPSSVTSIGECAFYGCSGLRSVTIPSSVTGIERQAFDCCSGLKKAYVSAGDAERVKTMIADSDSGIKVDSLTFVEMLADGGPYTETIDGIEWAFCVEGGMAKVGSEESGFSAVPRETVGALVIPSVLGGCPVTSIGDFAFSGCSGLMSVAIPSSVMSIGNQAFSGCSGLGKVYVSAGDAGRVKAMLVASGSGLDVDSLTFFEPLADGGPYTETVDGIEWTFEILDGEVTVRASDYQEWYDGHYVSAIPSDMVGAIKIPSMLGGCPVANIGRDAFFVCRGLTSVTIPSSVMSIGEWAFAACSGLTSVTIPSSVMSIGEWAFASCGGLTSVTIPSSVTSIGQEAFNTCIGLKSVTIPSSVTSIGDAAFYGCSGLTSIKLDDGLTVIGGGMFYGCSGLTSVTIPSSVTSIGEGAFYGCSGLTSVTLPLKFGSFSALFSGASRIKSVTWFDDGSKTSVSAGACRGLEELERVVIPASVMNVEDQAFYNCHKLKSVVFEGNAPDVGTEVFNGTPKDLVISVPSNSIGWDGGFTSTTLPSTWGGRAIAHVGESYDWSKGTTAPAAAVASSSVTVSNVVVHYILNSVQPEFAIRPADDMNFVNIITEVKGNAAVAIPETWAASYPAFAEKFGTDFTQALLKPSGKIGTGGTPMLVWQDYVAGTDPTNEKDVFAASITIVDGKVTISYTPELDDARKAMRKYTTWGKTSLMDTDWTEVQDGHEAEYNFFKVSVEMR